MKILIVNERLAKRTGTEIVARDFGIGLAARGNEVAVLTAERGMMAEEVEAAGIRVVTDPKSAPFTPDVIHFNDMTLARPVTDTFPGTPALLQWHRFVEPDFSIAGTRVTSIVGVSRRIVEKIERYTGVRTEGVFGNYVDLTRFEPRRTPLPAKPCRWLLVGQQKRGYALLARLSALAISKGIIPHVVGPRYFNRVENLPQTCSGYDLVFASGRCALEAVCAGAGVVVTDFNGVGGFVDGENVSWFHEGNFSFRRFRDEPTLKALDRAIREYKPEAAADATRLLREKAEMGHGIDRLIDLYHRALSRSAPPIQVPNQP